MPTTQFVTVTTEYSGITCQNVFAYYTNALYGSLDLQNQVMAEFESTVLTAWEDWLPDFMTITNISVRSSNYPFPSSEALALIGDITADPNDYLPPHLPLYVRATISGNLNGSDGLPYAGMRPVRGGGHYFSGIPEAWSTATGVVIPGTGDGAEFTAFLAVLDNPLVVALGTLNPVIWGGELAAAGSLPARDVVVAPITGFIVRDITRLKTRKA